MDAPPLGLFLDVDGPVSSPATRTVPGPLLDDLHALLARGIPVVLNTGRSTDFVVARVFTPLAARGLPAAARLHAVCEKGGTWLSAGAEGPGVVHADPALAVPPVCHELLETLVAEYGDAMFVDRSKRTMATVEARTDVPPGVYARRQRAFDTDLLAVMRAAGIGVRLRDESFPDADGGTPWRIDPSIIATDVESSAAGKALGARRGLALLTGDGPLPRTWHTVGDSRTDYAMADELHARGDAVTHVDVGPAPALADRPYAVTAVPGLVHEAAGGAHLRAVLASLAA
ncbi:hypothetical protein [Blastococcus saxobsidens]|uniref:Hydroxymethylpyrimidine pyrophosphatase-like HAD family hydrolase n=1 Tax=Blastococcus saxobsidens TaxID=138336 RepID=A0A4Q7Y4F9_9ACTN|nr:hypothetical protein [Blastococcus saxobsidens]RZU31710.1 hypothetical protein BKA19_1388 [Blastococcus saxobsidens]